MFESISSILPLIQYPAAALTIVGYWCVGDKLEIIRKTGFVMGLFGNIVWILYGLFPVQYGLIATNVVIFALGIRGYTNNTGSVNENLHEVGKKL